MSLLLERMDEYHENNPSKTASIQKTKDTLGYLASSPSGATYQQYSGSKEFEDYFHMLLDYKTQIFENGGQLAQFWLSFLDMVGTLLNTIYATRAGNWVLLLESYRDMIPYTFAYDHLNYAKYLTPMLAELSNLEVTHPDIYQEFANGNFSAQVSSTNSFGRTEMDKLIEVTINKDTKCPGGLKGFSTNIHQVNRWTLNATHRAEMRRCLQEQLHLKASSDIHQDLRKSRIEKDIKSVTAIIDVLKGTFIHPFTLDVKLLSISSGIEASEKVVEDLLNARKLGQKGMEQFVAERIHSNEKEFYEPVKKMNLATFKNLTKVVKVSVKDRMIPLKYHRDVFGQISIIMQKRHIDMKEVLSFPLEPLAWSLAGVAGDLKKTNKASLLHKIEQNAPPLEEVPRTVLESLMVWLKFKLIMPQD